MPEKPINKNDDKNVNEKKNLKKIEPDKVDRKINIIRNKILFYNTPAQPAEPSSDLLSQMENSLTYPAFVTEAVCAREIGVDQDIFIMKMSGTTISFFDSVISRKYDPYEIDEIDFFSGKSVKVRRYNVVIVDYTSCSMKRNEAVYSGEPALLIQRKVDILAGISHDSEYSIDNVEETNSIILPDTEKEN
ncbi:MAG: hypothetical protein SOZ62_03460 [Eubacteriales bacterium]|nr:hypothetical protein [Eubacteriales bacterium]